MFYLALDVEESTKSLNMELDTASETYKTDLLLTNLDEIDAKVSTAVMKATEMEKRALNGLEKDESLVNKDSLW